MRFKKFAGNGNPDSITDPSERHFHRVRQRTSQENHGESRLDKIWSQDFAKCKSKKDFEHYIAVNLRNKSNPYVKKAKEQLDEISRKEEATLKAERQREEQRRRLEEQRQHSMQPVHIYGNPASQNGSMQQKNDGWTPLGVVLAILLVVIIGYISYNVYQQKHSSPRPESPTPIINSDMPQPDPDPDPALQPSPQATPQPEPTPRPVQVWIPCFDCQGSRECTSCGGKGWYVVRNSRGEILTTQDCPVCRGTRKCQMCMGTGGHYETRFEY